jgi:GT2 family glycosyltransferase
MTTRALFQHIGFDPMMQYSYEDIDFTYRTHLTGIPVIVSHDCQIHHMEADKSFLATRFLHHVKAAYAR